MRLASSAGNDPLSPLARKNRLVTRPSLLVLTPCHSRSGLSLSQFVLSVQFSPSVAS